MRLQYSRAWNTVGMLMLFPVSVMGVWGTLQQPIFRCAYPTIKGAKTDMRYFARSKFSKSLVHKKNFRLIWQVVFELGYVFCQER